MLGAKDLNISYEYIFNIVLNNNSNKIYWR